MLRLKNGSFVNDTAVDENNSIQFVFIYVQT
jgi:hypothetical protein